jgi:hypothetical protein
VLALILIVMVRVLVVIFPVSRRAVLVRDVLVLHLPVPVSRLMRILMGTVLGTAMNAMEREPAGETIRAVQGLLPRAVVPVQEQIITVRPVLILMAPAAMLLAAAILAEILHTARERTAEGYASPATALEAARIPAAEAITRTSALYPGLAVPEPALRPVRMVTATVRVLAILAAARRIAR